VSVTEEEEALQRGICFLKIVVNELTIMRSCDQTKQRFSEYSLVPSRVVRTCEFMYTNDPTSLGLSEGTGHWFETWQRRVARKMEILIHF
jgi:hypothetical protein